MPDLKKYMLFLVCCICLAMTVAGQYADEDYPTVTIGDTAIDSDVHYQYKPDFLPVDSNIQVTERKISKEDFQSVASDDSYWYANAEREKKEKKSSGKSWWSDLMWFLLVAAFVALIIWFVASSNINLFRRNRPLTHGNDESDVEAENIFALDFERRIKLARDAGNYNLAVRLMYLRALRQLSDKELIVYRPEKTNGDYLFQLRGSAYYDDFSRLTRSFDYVWYGKFPLSKEGYEMLEKDFISFNQRLG